MFMRFLISALLVAFVTAKALEGTPDLGGGIDSAAIAQQLAALSSNSGMNMTQISNALATKLEELKGQADSILDTMTAWVKTQVSDLDLGDIKAKLQAVISTAGDLDADERKGAVVKSVCGFLKEGCMKNVDCSSAWSRACLGGKASCGMQYAKCSMIVGGLVSAF